MARRKIKQYVAYCPDCERHVVVINPKRVKGKLDDLSVR